MMETPALPMVAIPRPAAPPHQLLATMVMLVPPMDAIRLLDVPPVPLFAMT